MLPVAQRSRPDFATPAPASPSRACGFCAFSTRVSLPTARDVALRVGRRSAELTSRLAPTELLTARGPSLALGSFNSVSTWLQIRPEPHATGGCGGIRSSKIGAGFNLRDTLNIHLASLAWRAALWCGQRWLTRSARHLPAASSR